MANELTGALAILVLVALSLVAALIAGLLAALLALGLLSLSRVIWARRRPG